MYTYSISIVSISETFMNKLCISNEAIMLSALLDVVARIASTNVNESFITNCESDSPNHLASSCSADQIMDNIGRSGTFSLWILGNPYILGRWAPTCLILLYFSLESSPHLWSCNSHLMIWPSKCDVWSCSAALPNRWNFVSSIRISIILLM